MLKEKTKNNVIKLTANTVGADATFRPHIEEDAKRTPKTYSNLNSKAGITLIALIITIIVMLILVGVTISVALNGGLFNKAESAVTQTKIEQVKEALEIKKAEILADNNGEKPEGGFNNLNIDNLDIPDSLKNEYRDKLIVGTDGNLYYDPAVVTDAKEQDELKAHGINGEEHYTFKLNDLGNWEYKDSMFFFEKNIWELIGTDLSNNEKYTLKIEGGTMFATRSSNKELLSYTDAGLNPGIVLGDELFLVAGGIIDGKFGVFVAPIGGKDYLDEDSLTPEQFIATYGDVIFEFGVI